MHDADWMMAARAIPRRRWRWKKDAPYLIGAVIGAVYIFYVPHCYSEQAKAQSYKSWTQSSSRYGGEASYILSLLDHSHDKAFTDNFRLGSRFEVGEFNEGQYRVDLLKGMIGYARDEGRHDIAILLSQ